MLKGLARQRGKNRQHEAGLDVTHALEDLLGGEKIGAAELVVLAPIAPGRSWRTLVPPLRHRFGSFRVVGIHSAARLGHTYG
jgi:hypothetical protein